MESAVGLEFEVDFDSGEEEGLREALMDKLLEEKRFGFLKGAPMHMESGMVEMEVKRAIWNREGDDFWESGKVERDYVGLLGLALQPLNGG